MKRADVKSVARYLLGDLWRENEARRFMEREGGNVAEFKMVNSRHLE